MMDTVNLLAEIEVLKRKLENAVEIVRCKECKHGSDNKIYGCALIDYNTDEYHRMYADDYCSYGEREGE